MATAWFAASPCLLASADYGALQTAMATVHASLVMGGTDLFLALIAAQVLQVGRRGPAATVESLSSMPE